jgi:hypothetical protein
MIDRDIFEELFVLEMANNHWGRLERGLKIVNTFAQVVRFNNVRAAIKMQFRDVDSFIHRDFLAAPTSATSRRRWKRGWPRKISPPWCRPSERPPAFRWRRPSTRSRSIDAARWAFPF